MIGDRARLGAQDAEFKVRKASQRIDLLQARERGLRQDHGMDRDHDRSVGLELDW